MTTKRLDETVDGDVFYLVDDPSQVWAQRLNRYGDKYVFTSMDSDAWRPIDSVGTGREDQIVVVVHNTRAHLAETVAGSGGS